jgi:hypothetical protein
MCDTIDGNEWRPSEKPLAENACGPCKPSVATEDHRPFFNYNTLLGINTNRKL